ncbi:MAG: histidine kinase [Anaerolineae bacterium]
MGHKRSLWERLLRIPLFYKILLANSAIVALGAIAGTIITAWSVSTFPDNPPATLILIFAASGLAISFAVNFVVLRLALQPVDNLQRGVDTVRQGNLDVHIEAGPLSDERFDRLIDTVNQMLATLEHDRKELHRLSGEILEAQEEERRRVARELHDEAAQALTSLLVRLRLLERSPTPEEARQHVHELRKLTAEALEEVRRVALELRPTILDDLGLEAALAWRVDEFNDACPAHATLQVTGLGGRLPSAVELAFYRVAQEGLTNIARYAHATEASVSLVRDGNRLTMEIVDNGVGFDPAARRADGRHGLGLVGMRERLTLVGGELTISSRPGAGTRIIAAAPLASTPWNGLSYEQAARVVGR